MIIILAVGYILFTEPFAFQKEASARDLMDQFGHEYVKPEFQSFMSEADCKLDRIFPDGGKHAMGVEAALICTFNTPCGTQGERVVWHNRFVGAFTTAEPPSWTIADVCVEMLNPLTLKDVEENKDQGG